MNKKQNVKQEKELIASEIEKAIEDEEYRRRYAIWFVNKIFKNKEWFTWSANQIHKVSFCKLNDAPFFRLNAAF